MPKYKITVLSMDRLELQTTIEAPNKWQAQFAATSLRRQALALTADDLLQLDYAPTDLETEWWAERAYGRAS